MVSSYLPELLGVCDRIAVMSRGMLTEARPVYRWTEHGVMQIATRAGRISRGSRNDDWMRAIAVSEPLDERDDRPPLWKKPIRVRGMLGWTWTVLGPFAGLALITAFFAVLTRDSGQFFTAATGGPSPCTRSSSGPRRWG